MGVDCDVDAGILGNWLITVMAVSSAIVTARVLLAWGVSGSTRKA